MARELVNVGNFRFVAEAEAARLHLAEVGIQAFVANAEVVNMNWLAASAFGWVKIMVPDDQAAAARAVLDELALQAKARRENAPLNAPPGSCLACGAELPPGESRCGQCGWTFRDAESEETSESEEDDEPEDDSRQAQPTPKPLDLTPEEWAREDADSAAGTRLLVFLVGGGVLFLWLLRLLTTDHK